MAGIVALAVLGGGTIALAAAGGSPRRSLLAADRTGLPGPRVPSAPTRAPTPTPVPTPDARAHPDTHTDAGPDPQSRPGADDRPDGLASRRRTASDRGDDRRPRPGPPTVRLQQRRRRLAGPGRGRHPTLHDDLPGSGPDSIGPVRSARYYFIAWAAEWQAIYVHAGGSPQALQALREQGDGQLVYNADEFRYGGSFRRSSDRFAPHNLYTTGKQLRSLANRVGAKDATMDPAWKFGPDAPLSQRPVGGRIQVSYPANKIKYTYDRKTNSYFRSVTREDKQLDASTDKRVHPKNVVVMLMKFGPLNDGSPKASARSGRRRQGQGLDRDERPYDRGDLAKDVTDRADPVLRRRRPRRSP